MPGEDVGLKEFVLNAAKEGGVEISAEPLQEATVEPAPESKPEDKAEPVETKAPESKPFSWDDLAASWGHVSKEEFDKNPKNAGKTWVDSETFVRNMKEISESHQKRERHTERKLEELTGITAQLLARQKENDKRVAEADKRAKEKLIDELNAKLDAATDEGDKAGVRDIAKQIAILQGEIATVPPKDTDDQQHAEPSGNEPLPMSPEMARWFGRNQKTPDNPNGWYEDDGDPINAALTLFADKRSAALRKQEDGTLAPWNEVFPVLDMEIARKRGELEARYAPPKQTPIASPAGGGTPPTNNTGSISDLTEEERKFGQFLVREKQYKNLTEYAKALGK